MVKLFTIGRHELIHETRCLCYRNDLAQNGPDRRFERIKSAGQSCPGKAHLQRTSHVRLSKRLHNHDRVGIQIEHVPDALDHAQQLPGVGDDHLEQQLRLLAVRSGPKESKRIDLAKEEHTRIGVALDCFDAGNQVTSILIEHVVPIERRSIRQGKSDHRCRLDGVP
jgi:hypothetical protein